MSTSASIRQTSYTAAAVRHRAGIRTIAVALLVLVVGALPLLACVPAPLQDWPNHLARVHILDGLLRGTGGWERFYRFNTFGVPNVALDVGVLALTRAGLTAASAGQAFLLLTYAVFVGGFLALARRFGPVGLGRLAVAVACFYSGPLFWGLVNYVFAVGVLMAALSLWLGAGPRGRIAVAWFGAGALFFGHLIAAVAFVAVLGCFEAAGVARARGPLLVRLRGRFSCLFALVVVLMLMAAAPRDSAHNIGYHDPAGVWDFVRWKIVIFVQWAINGGTWPVRAVTAVGALVALVLALRGRPRPRLAWGAVAGCVGLWAIATAAPEHIGTGSLLDDRLALLPVLLFAAAVQPNLSRPWAARAARAALVGLALARAATLALVWLTPAAEYRAADAVLARLPIGTVVVMASARALPRVRWPEFWAKPYTSIQTQAVFHGDFVPMIFANPAQQPVALLPAFDGMNQPFDLSGPPGPAVLARLRAMCAGERTGPVPGVVVVVLYADPSRRFTDAAGTDVQIFGDQEIRVLDGCRLAGSAPAVQARVDSRPG